MIDPWSKGELMKRFSVSMAAALALGVLVTPSAQAGCDPVYDPGSPCGGKFTLKSEMPGGETLAVGKFVEHGVALRVPSYVKDTADDGLDVRMWVLYGKFGGAMYREAVASAPGLNVSTSVEWTSPAGVFVDWFQVRVCLGPGEDNCSRWVG
nr:hypothetical protein [uncultured bacterium]